SAVFQAPAAPAVRALGINSAWGNPAASFTAAAFRARWRGSESSTTTTVSGARVCAESDASERSASRTGRLQVARTTTSGRSHSCWAATPWIVPQRWAIGGASGAWLSYLAIRLTRAPLPFLPRGGRNAIDRRLDRDLGGPPRGSSGRSSTPNPRASATR